METLLAKYLANLTLDNAKRVVAYDRKHMMAECLLGDDYLAKAVLTMARNAVKGA